MYYAHYAVPVQSTNSSSVTNVQLRLRFEVDVDGLGAGWYALLNAQGYDLPYFPMR
jgi:hypothetical protein